MIIRATTGIKLFKSLVTKIGRESHARPGLLTVGWELRTINSRFSHRMKVPGTQMETTTKVIVTDQIGREREKI